jgi:23S rRNA (adenine-N6)-dimethyltransferase
MARSRMHLESRLEPNHPGAHLLRDPAVAVRLVRSAGVGPRSTVLDLGAGRGAVTAPLARTGARVLAIERDPAFVERLRRRFAADDHVRVVHADARTVPLPHRRFWVVASIPFSISTPLLRRLLSPVTSRLAGADLIVEWGLARRLTEPCPRSLEVACWAARFELRLLHRVPAASFEPRPAVNAAHLRIRRWDDVPPGIGTLLRAAYATPGRPARAVLGEFVGRRRAHRLLTASGIDPPAPAATVAVEQWLTLARAGQENRLAADRRTPPYPDPSC